MESRIPNYKPLRKQVEDMWQAMHICELSPAKGWTAQCSCHTWPFQSQGCDFSHLLAYLRCADIISKSQPQCGFCSQAFQLKILPGSVLPGQLRLMVTQGETGSSEDSLDEAIGNKVEVTELSHHSVSHPVSFQAIISIP